jgi:hypothetical protein
MEHDGRRLGGGLVHVRSRDQRAAAALVASGGTLAMVAGFLDWADFVPAGGEATTFRGLDLSAGAGSTAFGVGLVVVSAFLVARGGRTGGRGASFVAVILAAVVLLAAGYSSVAPADALLEFQDNRVAGEFGMSGEVGRIIDEGLESGRVEVTSLLGSWVATVGGISGLVGGIVGLVRARRFRQTRAAPEAVPSFVPPPPGLP